MIVDRSLPDRVLAVYAHPDDHEVSCGGTLAAWSAAGATVEVVILHRGDKGSSDPGVDRDSLATRRASEVEAAAAVLGVASVHLLGLADGESENDLALRERLVGLVRSLRPDAVVCPDPTALFFGDGYVNHRDHRVCGFATLDAVAPAASSPLYFPAAGSAHQVARIYLSGTLEPDTAVDISATLPRKVAAVACHESQLGEGGEWVHELVEQRAAEAGEQVGLRHAELFRLIRLT